MPEKRKAREAPGLPGYDPGWIGTHHGREASSWKVPARFGEYRLLRKLGGGGSGEVFLAEHETLGRQVALKLIHPGSIHFPEAQERLLHEARAASRLDHPGICPVFDIGSVDGVPFLAMRYIEGETLSRWIEKARRSTGLPAGVPCTRAAVEQLVTLIEKIARTLHAAHQAGLTHRDIKPANIMVAPGGEPVILDFGLAQLEGVSGTSGTRFGGIVGTPDYLPPEQIAWTATPRHGPQWDLYSLGVVLYEALTLRTPFRAPTLEQLQKNILHGEYTALRRLNPCAPPDLEIVLATALAREPGQRYTNAFEFAEDLRRIRELRPIEARRPRPLVRLRRWAQRHPLPTALYAFLGFALIGALMLLIRVHHLNRQTDRLLIDMRARGLAAASSGLFASNQRLALLLAAEGVRTVPTPETLSQLNRLLAGLREVAAFGVPGEPLRGAALSPDGRQVFTWNLAGTGRLWDRNGRLLDSLEEHGSRIIAAAFSPDQALIVATLTRGQALLWNPKKGEATPLKGHEGFISLAKFSPSGRFLLTASVDRNVRLWTLDGSLALLLPGHERLPLCAAICPQERMIATGDGEGSLRLWSPTGQLLRVIQAHPGPLRALEFSPCGERIASGGAGNQAFLWDREGRRLALFEGHEGHVTLLAFAPDGTELLTAAQDLTARLWHLDGTCKGILHGPRQRILGIQYSPAGERILLASLDLPVRLFDRQGRLVDAFSGHIGRVASASFSPDGEQLLIAAQEGTARLWSLTGRAVPTLPFRKTQAMDVALSACGEKLLTLDGNRVLIWDTQGRRMGALELPDQVYWAEFSPDGTRIVSGGKKQHPHIWTTSGERIAVLSDRATSHTRVHFAPDGNTILALSLQQPPTLWSARGELLARWEDLLPGPAAMVRFSPDGGRILWSDRGHRVFLTNPDGRKSRQLVHDPEGLPFLAWSPGGQRLVTTTPGGRVRVFDRDGRLQAYFQIDALARSQVAFAQAGESLVVGLQTGAVHLYSLQGVHLHELLLHEGRITGLSLSPDGNLLLSASEDGTAWLMRLPNQELLCLDGHQGPLLRALLFSGGTRALTVGSDGTARIWRLEAKRLLELAWEHSSGGFLPSERRRFADLLGPESHRP